MKREESNFMACVMSMKSGKRIKMEIFKLVLEHPWATLLILLGAAVVIDAIRGD